MNYDPFSWELQQDPYPTYEWLRNEAPVFHNEEHDLWVLSRYEDVQAAYRDWELYSNREGVDVDKTDALLAPGNMNELDGPPHDELRKLVQWWFSPKSIRQKLDEPIREEVKRLVAAVSDREEVDITSELAFELPTFVIAEMFDLPHSDRALLRSFMAPVFARHPNDPVPPQEALDAGRNIGEYFLDVIQRRRSEPLEGRDDIISVMLGTELHGVPLTDEQVLGTVAHLFVASSGTTQDAISNTLWLLAEHPEERQKLIEDPSLVPNAVEESLRFESVVQNTTRALNEDVELHGTTIPKGATVVLLIGSANRDERYWDEPERFDVSRVPRRQLGFADGPHHCIGAPIARFEIRTSVEEVLLAMPSYEVSRPPKRAVSHVARGYEQLWIKPMAKSATPA